MNIYKDKSRFFSIYYINESFTIKVGQNVNVLLNTSPWVIERKEPLCVGQSAKL